MNPQILDVFDGLQVFELEVRAFSGRRILRAEDLGRVAHDVPQEVVSWGSKKLIDPEHLKVFTTLRRRAEAHAGSWSASGTRPAPCASLTRACGASWT